MDSIFFAGMFILQVFVLGESRLDDIEVGYVVDIGQLMDLGEFHRKRHLDADYVRVMGAIGVTEVVELPLTAEETEALHASARQISEQVAALEAALG